MAHRSKSAARESISRRLVECNCHDQFLKSHHPFRGDIHRRTASRFHWGENRVGRTDGAELAVLGLPTPNIFTGGNNFHGFLEFNSRRGMEKTVETLVNLVSTYAGSAVAN
jgi:hypothetical protein